MGMKTKRYHCIFDAKGVPAGIIFDKTLLERVIHDLASICDMNVVSGPHTVDGIPENLGVTTVAVVDFSDITVHTFAKTGEVKIDVFSCKPYNPSEVCKYLLKTFAVKKKNVIFFKVKYPKKKHKLHL